MLAGETRGSASFHAHARNTWHLAMLAFRAHAGTPPASRSHTPCSGPARGTLRCTGSGVVRRALRSCDLFAPRSYGSCLTARAARSCSRKPLGSRLHAARSRKPFGSRSHAARSRRPFGSRSHAARSRKPFGSRLHAARSRRPFGSRRTQRAPAGLSAHVCAPRSPRAPCGTHVCGTAIADTS
jgi:hypothetical protein